MNWLCGRYLQLICGWHTPNIRLIYGQKPILRLWSYRYHSCFLYDDQDFSFRPYIWRMSAVCRPYVSRISAVYQPYIRRISAVYQPYIRRISAVCQPSVRRGTAVCQPYISRTSAVCQPYLTSQFSLLFMMGNSETYLTSFVLYHELLSLFLNKPLCMSYLVCHYFRRRETAELDKLDLMVTA